MKQAAGIIYTEKGQGRLPIVCLHGIGGNAHSFDPQLEGLSDTHRILAWNMSGYGGSEPIADPTFPKLAAKLRDFIDALNIKKVHLCGQSIGGMLAMETACLFPERVQTLVLIATTSAFGGRDDSFKDAFVAARLKPLDEGKTICELAQEFIPEITGPIASARAIESAIASMAKVPEDTYRKIIRCLVTFDRREDIGDFCFPTCLISGEYDQNAPTKTMARMSAKIPGAEFHEIKGAGHLVNLEAGEETNQILRKFYGNHS